MGEIYVHTFSYRYYGRRGRRSRTMFPISYGPFRTEEDAREWIRQRGMTRATTLMASPASENIKVAPGGMVRAMDGEQGGFVLRQTHQTA